KATAPRAASRDPTPRLPRSRGGMGACTYTTSRPANSLSAGAATPASGATSPVAVPAASASVAAWSALDFFAGLGFSAFSAGGSSPGAPAGASVGASVGSTTSPGLKIGLGFLLPVVPSLMRAPYAVGSSLVASQITEPGLA